MSNMHWHYIIYNFILIVANSEQSLNLFRTLISPYLFNHYNLLGYGCFKVAKLSFSTNLVLATLVQLSPSIIILHTLLLTRHLVWKMFSCYSSSSLICTLKTWFVTRISPFTRYSTSLLSSKVALYFFLLLNHSHSFQLLLWILLTYLSLEKQSVLFINIENILCHSYKLVGQWFYICLEQKLPP